MGHQHATHFLGQDSPVCIFKTENNELLGIFKSFKTCRTHCFEGKNKYDFGIGQYISRNSSTTKSKYDFKVYFKYADTEQRELLGTKEYIIL